MSDMQRKLVPGPRRPSQEWTVFLLVAIGGVVQAVDRMTPILPVGVVSKFFARGASAGGSSRSRLPLCPARS